VADAGVVSGFPIQGINWKLELRRDVCHLNGKNACLRGSKACPACLEACLMCVSLVSWLSRMVSKLSRRSVLHHSLQVSISCLPVSCQRLRLSRPSDHVVLGAYHPYPVQSRPFTDFVWTSSWARLDVSSTSSGECGTLRFRLCDSSSCESREFSRDCLRSRSQVRFSL
jgi:hypothetical protein